ncbi:MULTISPECIES: hypothetical protein [Novosphingobium]|uniref:hypothetical protein n=1 Tax=Novosphingobium TaxID=165696 RepID=UPI000D6EAD0D|nr:MULTISPECIES: hypothetical protein [Novosphingobium]
MIATVNRLRTVGWLVLLALCLGLVLVTAFRVNALRSQIHRAEARIVALKQERLYLETEFETRSNQQQLKTWNDVEFGYAAPGAGQYLEGERALAALSVPARPDAPAPIRVASVDDSVIASSAFPAMVSPLSGKPQSTESARIAAADEDRDEPVQERAKAVETLSDRLGKVVDARPGGPVRKPTGAKVGPAGSGDDGKGRAAAAPAEKKGKPSEVAASPKTKPEKGAAPAGKPAVAEKPAAKPAKTAAATRPAKPKEARVTL